MFLNFKGYLRFFKEFFLNFKEFKGFLRNFKELPRKNATVFCCYRMLFNKKHTKYLGTFTLKYPYLKWIS